MAIVIPMRRLPNGSQQVVHRFPNGYGASVVRGPLSYGGAQGLFELAVVEFTGPEPDSFDITYDTPITSDVEGHLTEAGVNDLLAQIEALPARGEAACTP